MSLPSSCCFPRSDRNSTAVTFELWLPTPREREVDKRCRHQDGDEQIPVIDEKSHRATPIQTSSDDTAPIKAKPMSITANNTTATMGSQMGAERMPRKNAIIQSAAALLLLCGA